MTIKVALQYDKRLFMKTSIDGLKILCRQSPFSAQKSFEIKEFRNTFLGSGRWMRDLLIKMDTQRQTIVHDAMQNNKKIRAKRSDNRSEKNIADIFEGGGDTFIN